MTVYVGEKKVPHIVGGLELNIQSSQINVMVINTTTEALTRPTLNKVTVSMDMKVKNHNDLAKIAAAEFKQHIADKTPVPGKRKGVAAAPVRGVAQPPKKTESPELVLLSESEDEIERSTPPPSPIVQAEKR